MSKHANYKRDLVATDQAEDTKLLPAPAPYQFKHRKVFRMGPRPARENAAAVDANASTCETGGGESAAQGRVATGNNVGTVVGIDTNGRAILSKEV